MYRLRRKYCNRRKTVEESHEQVATGAFKASEAFMAKVDEVLRPREFDAYTYT